jgi:hypothetical protein
VRRADKLQHAHIADSYSCVISLSSSCLCRQQSTFQFKESFLKNVLSVLCVVVALCIGGPSDIL